MSSNTLSSGLGGDRPITQTTSRRWRAGMSRSGGAGFRPPSRRRTRLMIAMVLAAVAFAGNLAVYSSLDERIEVLQAGEEIPAGSIVEPEQLRVTRVAVDSVVPVVPADESAAVIGRYARSRIAAGTLIGPSVVQQHPLVASRAAVVAIRLPEGTIPDGLAERSRVLIVVPESPGPVGGSTVDDDRAQMPGDPGDPSDGAIAAIVVSSVEPAGVGTLAVSVEIDRADAVRVARADQVRIVLVSPDGDRWGGS